MADPNNVPIAIIGMACRFAGDVDTPSKLWDICAEGRSAWSKIPASRFNLDGIYHPNGAKVNTSNVIGGHFLEEDVALFDAGFFNFPAELASSFDPQFRLQLENTYEALESAGLTLQGVAGSNTSVFAGSFFKDYNDAHLRDPETLPRSLLMGVGAAMASNRLSHFFDLRGASMSIDTGCSTTLTALHQACQNLRSGESDMSIIGGANVLLNPDNFIIMTSLTLLSPAGRSYAFDDRASGYGRGEGSATVIIKRLDDALRDGDPIRAIIRGSACNQDGKTETITTPSQEAQEELIRLCYSRAGLDLADTTYFEAHGTGTPTGDPIEARAIASVFREKRSPEHPLLIGSVKTNVGHCETASGLASIIKVALALERGKIPPSINFEKENKNIHLAEWNLKLPREVEVWPEVNGIRRASVNNFGYGGTNAHIIMESYESYIAGQNRKAAGLITNSSAAADDTNGSTTSDDVVIVENRGLKHGTNGYYTPSDSNDSDDDANVRYKSKDTNGVTTEQVVHTDPSNGLVTNDSIMNENHDKLKNRVIRLSGKDEQAAIAMASNLKDYLQTVEIQDEEDLLDNLTYTLGQRRSVLPWAGAHSVDSIPSLIKALEFGKFKPSRTNEAPKIGFVFTGQGAQWWAMGRELIEAYPVFKECVIEAEGYLKEFGSEWSLIDELTRDAETTRVNELAMSTPLTAVVQIGIVRLLRSWGVTPSAVTSHSSGEIAAAYTAGALTLRAAMAIGFARGQCAGSNDPSLTRKGGMVAVGLGAQDVEKYISRVTSGQVVVACLNSPSSSTVSGDVSGVEELQKLLQEDDIFARRLKIDAAYHSHHMKFIEAPYLAWLQNLVTEEGYLDESVIYSSPTTGKRETSGKLISSPQHWVTSLTHPVQFVDSFRNMCFENSSSTVSSVDVVIEVGPHAALSGPVQEIIARPDFNGCKVTYFPSLIRKNSAVDTMQALAADLIRSGYPVNMDTINFPFGRRGVSVLSDLPRYPWNHTIRHWSEPRINKAHRFRTEAPHDLLGHLVLGTNMITPSWRHLVRIAELPWLRDHVVQSQILYPGAGYLCMAIEAAHQTAKASDNLVLGYEMRDIDFLQALVVPDTVEGIEVQITFRQCSEKAIFAKGWKEFVVYSVTTDNQWIEHCKGLMKANIAPIVGNVPGDEAVPVTEDHIQWNPPTSATNQLSGHSEAQDYRKYIDPRDVYQSMSSVTICHGPIFQNLSSTKARGNQSVTAFTIADTAATMPYQHQHSHVIDPTTLDSLFQAGYAGYIAMPGIPKLSTPLVPRSIKKLYLAHNISSQAGHSFKAFLDMNKATTQGFDTDIVVIDDKTSSTAPVLKMDSFVTQSLGNVLAPSDDAYENEKLATIKWAPDLSYADSNFLKKRLGSTIQSSEAEIIMDLKRLTIHFINQALSTLTDADVGQAEWYHKKFHQWMRSQLDLAQQNKLASNSSEWLNDSAEEQKNLVERANIASVNGEMVCRLGPQIVSMMRREITPLELMLEGKLLYRYYVDALGWSRSSQQVGDLVKMFAHKNPRSKILEIGGGTGGTTQYVLNALGTSNSGGPLAASYDFTDISSGFFEAAQEKFSEWESIVRYKKLDIEQDPTKQGFETGTYDLIIACQVLHATKNMEHTMTNVRNLLKPGGKLVLFETTQDPTDLFFTFGLLPGWWLSEEDNRNHGPSLSIDMWNQTLKKTGFCGVETEVHDCDSEELYSFSVMTSTATSPTPRAYDSDVVLVTGSTSPPRHWIDHLTSSIANVTGAAPTIQSLESLDSTGKLCIFLGDLNVSLLKEPTQQQFDSIKSLVTKSKGVLWATVGGAVNCENPDASLSQGFLRTLRVEYAGKRLVALDLDPKKEVWSTRSISALTAVFKNIFNYSKDNVVMDFEFADRDGVIQVPRYYQDSERNKIVFPNSAHLADVELKAFHQPSRPLRLTVGTPGLLDTLAWKDDPDANKDLREDMIEVEPKAFGLNFRDVMVAMGQLEADYMGFECSGVVRRVGPSAAAQGFSVGDRIATLMRGHYGSLVRVEWTSAIHIPDEMTFDVAATLPMSYSTAYFSLYELGRVKKGESVLIHAASGGLGQAAIVLAKHAGAEIFVTVGTEKKREFIINEYDIQPDHIFSSRDETFAAGVMAMTQGKGVDVVLNTLAGPLLQESFNCVARFGRFVEIGKRDLELNNLLEMGAFTRSISISSFDLLLYGEHRGLEVSRVMKDIIALFKQGAIAPVKPVTVYPLSDLERAYRLMQAGKHIGKIIISVSADDMVPVLPKTSAAKLHADYSYLIVGGVGGIGRSVCEWMVNHGAKNLIVLSRSANQEKIRPFTAEMEKLGCKVKGVGCDISNALDLAIALNACARDMPPIKGVIQGAMVLQDSIIEQMTLEQYNAAIRPKVHGSWNLHNQLVDLDFFVMLSSLSGIGGFASQCNYSAGNTFEDALARYRTSKGLHGASIDIGIVKSVGYVAENRGTADRLKKSGYKELTEDDVLKAIESSITSSPKTQMLLGLNGADWEESGLARDQRFTPLTARQSSNATSVSKAASGELSGLIAAATTLEEAAAVVLDGITKKLMDIFMITEAEVDPSKSLSGFGVDSLVAVELRNMLALRTGAEVSIFDIMQSASIQALSVTVASKSSHIDPLLVPS